MKQGFVITGIKRNGLREMVTDNNSRNTFTEKEKAEKHLANIMANNNPETIEKLMGKDLQVTPTELYDHGDSTRTVF